VGSNCCQVSKFIHLDLFQRIRVILPRCQCGNNAALPIYQSGLKSLLSYFIRKIKSRLKVAHPVDKVAKKVYLKTTDDDEKDRE